MRGFFIAAAMLLAGCDSCGGGGPVPFGLDGSATTATGDPDQPGGADPGSRPDGRSEGRVLPAGTLRVNVEGAPIESESPLRALWAHDVDGDGDRDAVLVAEGPANQSPVRVLFARRDGAVFEPPRELGHAPAAAPGCALETASLTNAGDWLIARGVVACPDGVGGSDEHFLLSTDGAVRLQERVAGIWTEDPGAMRLAFGVDDVNEDGRDDLTVEVALTHHDVEDRINLHWLDRTSGLSRQTEEPAATLNARSRDALRQLRGDRAAALSGSRAVLRLHRALCREPGHARLRIGNTVGIECGDSDGAGRAITTVVRAHAANGEAMQALAAFAAMEEPGRRINDERRQYARRALGTLPASASIRVQDGPEVAAPPARDFTVSALGFLDEGQVLVRSMPPHRWRVGGGLSPVDPAAADLRVLDPQKRFAVASLESRCGAVQIRIVVPGTMRPSPVPRPPQSTPPLYGSDEGCEDRWVDDGLGWHVLGWAPQGIVAAREAELRLVPLDVEARPSESPRTLSAGTPPPSPLPAGQATIDGRFRVELRGPAVVVHEIGRPAEVLWPEGWAEREGALSHPAISPSGRRIAVVQGGRLVLLERAQD